MDFCVLIKISKQKVTFWYQSGSSSYESLLVKDLYEFPLYFFVDGSDFIFGEFLAIDRFNSNDPNAFGNYFEIIKDPSNHFTIAGNKKPVKQLLYYGIEKNLNFFINQVLYKNDSLESYRQNFPIRFWYDSDLEDREKSLIDSLFIDAGYDNIDRIDYYSCLFEVLANNNVINNRNAVLILNGINNTLHLELFKNISESLCGASKLDGHGADPSVRVLSEMIIEDIEATESHLSLNKEFEVASLLSYSASRLENVTPIIKGDAILTDGKKHYFEVKQRVLNERLLYNSNDGLIFASINDLISNYGINIENLTILLNTKEISTPYMINKFLTKYPNVKGVDYKYVNDSLKLLFSKEAQSGYKVKSRTKPVIVDTSVFSPDLSNSQKLSTGQVPPVVNIPPSVPSMPPPVVKSPSVPSMPPPVVKSPSVPSMPPPVVKSPPVPSMPPPVVKSPPVPSMPPPVLKSPPVPSMPPPVVKSPPVPSMPPPVVRTPPAPNLPPPVIKTGSIPPPPPPLPPNKK